MAVQIHYIENQYDNATKENYKLMSIINADHYDKLVAAAPADADIEMLRAAYQPIHDDYKSKNIATIAADGTYKGWTSLFEGLMSDLTKLKVPEWDIAIQSVYIKGKPEYDMILPGGRGPFTTGTYDNRIDEVAALAERLLDFPALAATQVLVDAYHTTLDDNRSKQQAKEQLADAAHTNRENARLECAKYMLADTGYLMWKYKDDLNQVGNFFEWSLIKTYAPPAIPEPTPSAIILQPAMTKALIAGPKATQTFLIINTGTQPVTICTGPTETETCAGGYILNAGVEFTGTLADMGLLEDAWLKATNNSAEVITVLFMVIE